MTRIFDYIVVGGGHAGASAAIAAVDAGCEDVLIVREEAPEECVGGNNYFMAGAHGTVHASLADVLSIVTNVMAEQAAKIDTASYTADDFFGDVMRLGGEDHGGGLESKWMGCRGLALSVEDGGRGFIRANLRGLQKRGVELWFDTPAVQLVIEGSAVTEVVVRKSGQEVRLKASAVILACGGYESSRELRMKYLGSDWKHARIRGTPYNTGDGILMAQAIGPKLVSDSADVLMPQYVLGRKCASNAGDGEMSNQFTKFEYPLGIMVRGNEEHDFGLTKYFTEIIGWL